MSIKEENGHLKIAIATGTRADWGLLLPLARALRDADVCIEVLATNSHLMQQLGHTVDEIRADGFEPAAMIPAEGTADEVCAMALTGFSRQLRADRPDALVILGDRIEMLGAATAALLEGVPIVHIAGGTVSEGAFDDSIRHSISKMATLHLVETDTCRNRLIQMGEDPQSVINTGAIGVYNVLQTPRMSRAELEESLGSPLPPDFILATLHAATLDSSSPLEQMREFIAALEDVMAENSRLGVLFTYPNNDVDPAPQIHAIEDFARRNPGRVVAVASLGRVRYMTALGMACAVAGNSSSGIVEAASMGLGILDVGCRQQGREAPPAVYHVGASRREIAAGLGHILTPEFRKMARQRINPYFRDNTPQIMTRAILEYPFSPYPKKKFHTLQ